MAGSEQIKDPGKLAVPVTVMALFGAMVALGAGTFAIALKSDPTRAWASFVQNHFYFLSLGLGGVFFAALQWLTGAMWSAPVRRLAESFSSYLPVAAVTFVILYFGMHELYPWTHVEHVQGDPVLEHKAAYLNVGFFVIRNVVALLVWFLFARKLIGNSLKQDKDKDPMWTVRNRAWSPAFMMIFAITFTMAAFDQLMSLDPHWFSTMFGVYCFAGLFYSTLALTTLLTLLVRRSGKLDGIVSEEHLHDLGKLMFAFTVFWAYIGFSQFMLIWYANMPEETGYFIRRFNEGWLAVSIFLFVGKFLTPFFLLLQRQNKRSSGRLAFVGCWMMFAQWIDILWIVQPEFFKSGPQIGWVEIGTMLGFAGAFGLVVSRFLSRNTIVAIGDPKLNQAVFHHHQ